MNTIRNLIIYPNCSKGGVASVIRGRAEANPEQEFDVLYFRDRGGRDAFDGLSNVTVRISRPDRVAAYASYVMRLRQYDQISFLSCPELVGETVIPSNATVTYEFHSSDMKIVRDELTRLDLTKLQAIVAPSRYMASRIAPLLPAAVGLVPQVVPNLVDGRVFFHDSAPASTSSRERVPLIWVGRFDKGKSYRSFLRLLGNLPPNYMGVAITSLEHDPARAGDFLGEMYAHGVGDRLDVLLNVPQAEMGEIYRGAAHAGGYLIGTSLLESFGYSVAEAIACGLRVVAFDLPPLREHRDPEGLLHTVDIGNVLEMRDYVLSNQ